MATMLYRFSEEEKPRKEKIHGMNMDYKVVEDSQVEQYLDKWWSKTPKAAKELYDKTMSEEPEKQEEQPKEPVVFNDLHEQGDGQSEPEGLDKSGLPWEERINTKDHKKTKKGNWKLIPGKSMDYITQVKEEIKPKE